MQLASIRYSRGLIEIEPKDEMRRRGIRSPDRAEAIMLAFGDRTPAALKRIQAHVEGRELRDRQHALLARPRATVSSDDDSYADWEPNPLVRNI
jgi:hypothetical protein